MIKAESNGACFRESELNSANWFYRSDPLGACGYSPAPQSTQSLTGSPDHG